MITHYLAECDEREQDCGRDRDYAERTARRWSDSVSCEGVAYVVTIRDGERVGHKVFQHGSVNRVEGEY